MAGPVVAVLMTAGGMALAATADDSGNLTPQEVLVIANRASAASMDVARHYIDKRGIPKGNLFIIDYGEYAKTDPLDDNPAWLSHSDFRTKVAGPLRKFLEDGALRGKILCFVTTFDTPYRVGGFELTESERADPAAQTQSPPAGTRPTEQDKAFRQANASFDSELAWLYRPDVDQEGLSDYQRKCLYMKWSRNPFLGGALRFREFRKRQLVEPNGGLMYMVARLDGPSVEIAKGLVDKAMQAEANGVRGKGYFDAQGPGETREGMALGDWWIRQAWIQTRRAGFDAVQDTRPALFGPGECPNALFYWGWYKSFDYTKCFNGAFAPGAIACHIASFEAANLRWSGVKDKDSHNGGPWCTGFLRDGVTVTIGPVSEPFLHAFPHTEEFFPRLYEGWTVGEAYWSAVPHVSWMMVLIGDPLYAPFAGKNRLVGYAASRPSPCASQGSNTNTGGQIEPMISGRDPYAD